MNMMGTNMPSKHLIWVRLRVSGLGHWVCTFVTIWDPELPS